MTRQICVLLSLIILCALVSAEGPTPGETALLAAFPPWMPLVAASLFIGYGLAALAYMLSTVFRMPEMNVWAKTEVAEVTASAFLVLIILIALSMSDSVFAAATGKTPMDTSLDFTRVAADKLFHVYIDSVYLSFAVGSLTGTPPQYSGTNSGAQQDLLSRYRAQSSQIKLDEKGGTITTLMISMYLFNVNYQPFWSANIFNAHFGTIQSVALSASLIAVFSNFVLDFIRGIAIPVMIPFGLFLSVFSITRKMGRTLIAFGIGLYIFVPASILIAQTMYDSAYKTGIDPPEITKPPLATQLSQTLIAIQVNQLLTALYGSVVLIPHVAGDLAYVPVCATGGGILSLICAPGGPAAVFTCATAFSSMCSGVISPIFHQPIAKVLASDLFKSLIVIYKLNALSNLFGADIPGELMIGVSAPAPIASAGIVANYVWPATGIGVLAPNPFLMIANMINMGLAPIAGLSEFKAHLYLEPAVASKLTDVLLEFTPYVLQYAVPVMLIPVIVILMVITGIRSISPMIGGEVQILGVSELV